MLSKTAQLIAFVATTDANEARHFYRDILGWRLVANEEFALVFDAQGMMLRIAKVKDFQPLPFTVLGWNVPDIQADIQSLEEKGVHFERFEGLPQDMGGVKCVPRLESQMKML